MAVADQEVRELVRIRHELRVLAERGDRRAALPLLERMHHIAARDEVESAAVETELVRWRFVLGLGFPY